MIATFIAFIRCYLGGYKVDDINKFTSVHLNPLTFGFAY